MTSTQNVFESEDIVEHIISYLPYYMVSGLGPVNKTCSMVSRRLYASKRQSELVQPFTDVYDDILNTVKLFNNSSMTVRNMICRNNCCMSTTCKHNVCNMVNVFNYTETILNKNLWVVLVNDFERMEEYFKILSELYILYKCYCTNRYGNSNNNIVPLSIQMKIEDTRKKICDYLYIEFPEKYNVETLRQFAKFKNIKHFYRMKRIALIRHLKRPVNESYYICE